MADAAPASSDEMQEVLMSISSILKDSADSDLQEIMQLLKEFGCASRRNDVSEIYSPPRVIAMAARMGLRPGFALDLTVIDPDDGLPWDFDNPKKRAKAMAKVREEEPTLLIGSPMCRAFSNLQTMNFGRMDRAKVQELLAHGIMHLRFCISLYREQMRGGRYFLHEHPDFAKSWGLAEMVQLLQRPDVIRTSGDMCAHGMKATDAAGEGLVLKPTGWATNSPYIAAEVSARCSSR